MPADPKAPADPKGASAPQVPVGGYVLKADPIELNPGRPRTTLKARNTGGRPIQVGSHFQPLPRVRPVRCLWPAPRHPGEHSGAL